MEEIQIGFDELSRANTNQLMVQISTYIRKSTKNSTKLGSEWIVDEALEEE